MKRLHLLLLLSLVLILPVEAQNMSVDLCNWRFERIAFSQQKDGRMGPERVGERPKVLKCPATGEFVMLMHTDNLRYKDPCVCYATSKSLSGPWTYGGECRCRQKAAT